MGIDLSSKFGGMDISEGMADFGGREIHDSYYNDYRMEEREIMIQRGVRLGT